MGIGFSFFLLAVGPVLAFAVCATVVGIDNRVVGVILTAAGALGLVLTMVVFTPIRNRNVTATHVGRRITVARRRSAGHRPGDPHRRRVTPQPAGHGTYHRTTTGRTAP